MNGNTTGTVGVCCVDGAKRGEIRKCNVWTPIVFFKGPLNIVNLPATAGRKKRRRITLNSQAGFIL